jgi:hypothetical protein
MGQTKMLVLVAGAVLSVGASAFAQGGGNYNSSGFSISDASGDNRLTIGGAAQFRFNISSRDDDRVGDTDDLATGFSTPLTRFRFGGSVGSKEFTYKMQMTSTEGGSFSVDDVYGQWDFGNGWNFRWGQFNLPVMREVVIGAESHLGSDFSILAQNFGQGYSQGVQVGYGDEQIRAMFAFSDGADTAGTDFTSTQESDYGLSARVEGIVVGSGFDRFDTYSSWNSTQGDNVLVGAALHFEDGGETAGTDDEQLFIATADAQWEGPGYTVSGALVYAKSEFAGGGDRSDYGLMVQGGYFFTDAIEGFARIDAIFLDGDSVAPGADDNLLFLGIGANYYPFIESNAVKFTAQLGYSFNDNDDVAGSDTGFLGQDTDGEVALQFQGQFIF